MNKKELGERLRDVREKLNYTQEQIAKILKIDRSTYTCYEIGKSLPDIFTILALADIFQLPLEKLLNYQPKNPKVHERINQSEMFRLSKRELDLILYYRAMNEKKQKQLLHLISSPDSENLF